MPNRIIREAILSSEPVASLDWAEEVFYRRLMSVLDDYGRTEANAQLLRSKCYPLHTEKQVKAAQVETWLQAIAAAHLVVVYTVEGKRYLELLKFQQQQRSASKCPPPPIAAQPPTPVSTRAAVDSNCAQPPADAHLGVVVVGGVSVVEGVGEGPPEPRTRTKRVMPADFAISDRVRQWARDKGHTRLAERFDHFVSKAKAKAYRYADWDEAFMNAVRDDWAAFDKPMSVRDQRSATAAALCGTAMQEFPQEFPNEAIEATATHVHD